MAGRRPVCIIAVGTALTLDLVDSRGRHRGGAIVPAPALMKASLLTQTNGIRRRARGGASRGGLFARSTRAAIEQGSRYAAAAVIDRAVGEARKLLGRPPLVLLTGGGAPALRPLVRTAHIFVPDLVLSGLAALASSSRKLPQRWSLAEQASRIGTRAHRLLRHAGVERRVPGLGRVDR